MQPRLSLIKVYPDVSPTLANKYRTISLIRAKVYLARIDSVALFNSSGQYEKKTVVVLVMGLKMVAFLFVTFNTWNANSTQKNVIHFRLLKRCYEAENKPSPLQFEPKIPWLHADLFH